MSNNNHFVTHFRCTLWDHIGSTEPHETIVTDSPNEFVSWLKSSHKRRVTSKSDNLLLSPSFFQPNAEGVRAANNVVFANSVWLDIDGGDLTPKRLSLLFPRIRIVVFNTYSSTKAEPRWRAFMPTSAPVTYDEYGCITRQILQVMDEVGFTARSRLSARPGEMAHGIDTGKLGAASPFYLPCQPADPSGKIWRDFAGDERLPIIASHWLEHPIPIDTPQRRSCARDGTKGIDETAVAAIIDQWRDVAGTPGEGNGAFFLLGYRLAVAGMMEPEIRGTLDNEATRANTPSDRLRQIGSIIASLKRYGRISNS